MAQSSFYSDGDLYDPESIFAGSAAYAQALAASASAQASALASANSAAAARAAITYISAAAEGVPNDGIADASASLQALVDRVTTTNPFGAFIDCSDGVFRLDHPVIVGGNDIVIGGASPGQLASFHRNHDTGALFKFTALGTGTVSIARSGLRYCALRDLGTSSNGNGQRTGMFGTWANSPYGAIFETAFAPIIDNVEFYNEGLATFGVIDPRPENLKFSFNRVLEAGRTAWNLKGGTLSATLYPRSGSLYGNTVNIEAGFISGGVVYPSCDYGLVCDEADGFSVDQFHIQSTNTSHILLPGNSVGKPLHNFAVTNGQLDIGLGSGLVISGSVPIKSVQFDGWASPNGYGTSSIGVNISNPVDGVSIDLERLEGWTGAGVIINNAAADNVNLRVSQAQNNTGTAISINAGKRVTVNLGLINGLDVAGTGAQTVNGVYVGSGVDCSISGGKITKCANGVVIDAGATNTGITGVDLRGNFTNALFNIGTNTNAKGNPGAANIPLIDSVPAEQAALSLGSLVFRLSGANFNSTADQAIPITLPTGYTRYRIQAILFSNPSISLTTAVGGVYTSPSKGGIALVAASQAYSALTTNTAGANGSLLNVAVTNFASAFYNSATMYLSLTTPQGSAATADVTVFIQPLP